MLSEVVPRVPDEQPGPARLGHALIAAGGMVLALAGIRAANGIVGPTLLGFVIVVTVYPLATWLRSRRVSGWIAIAVTMAVCYGIILVLVGGTVLALAQFVRLLPNYSEQFVALQQGVVDWLGQLGITTSDLQDAIASVSPGQIAGAVTAAAGSVGGVLAALVLMLTVTYFFVLDSAGFPVRFARVARLRPDRADAFAEFAQGTRKYLLVATVFGSIVAVADVIILYVLGIPSPWVWGLLAFLTGFIPNVGFVIGLIPVSVLALLSGGWADMVIVIVAYSGVNFVLQSLIQPKFVGDSVGLATTVTFLSLAFWTFILGPIGAILAVPLTLLARAVLLSGDPTKEWAIALISSTPKEREQGRLEEIKDFGESLDDADEPPDNPTTS